MPGAAMDSSTASREKRNAALASVAAAVFLTAFKLVVGLQTNSLGVLSEAAHSALDLGAALITLAAVVLAAKPADEEHPYGHGKFENVSALIETLLLFVTCSWIIWEAVHRLSTHRTHVEANVWSFVVMGVAIAVDLGRSRQLARVAREHNSQALEADALHFSSDVWSSLVVIAGLVFVSFGYPALDSVAAIGVALLVLFVSYRLGRRTIDALVDRVPAGLYEEVSATVRQVDGVQEVRQLRLRTSGPNVFVDTIVGIPRTMPFEGAHEVMDAVERAVHTAYPDADVTVHAEPVETGDETIADKVRMVALAKGMRAPHNLEVHRVDGRYFIDFDLEHPSGRSFVDAHAAAVEVEREVRRRIDHVEKVTIHLEEYQQAEAENRAAGDEQRALRERIRAQVLRNPQVLDCSDVTVLHFGAGYNVSVTCQLDAALTLASVHRAVAETESDLYREFERVRRVTIRAEPASVARGDARGHRGTPAAGSPPDQGSA
jgi:cation diffusion facilitator family transporter